MGQRADGVVPPGPADWGSVAGTTTRHGKEKNGESLGNTSPMKWGIMVKRRASR